MELREKLENYFGAINEARMGVLTGDFPEKPEELRLYELSKSTGLPLVVGGLMDQPHMWLDQIEMIENIKKLYDIQARTDAKSVPITNDTGANLMQPMRMFDG